MQPLTGSVKRYDWGSIDVLPELLGIPVDGRPVAEYWLGAHPLGSARLVGVPLDRAINQDPSMLGEHTRRLFGDRLPFMVKLLSATRPLSLQAHPNREDAQEGFERENRAELPLEASERTYKDPWDKPELVVALTQLDALAGFRDPLDSADLFSRLGISPRTELLLAPLRHRQGSAGLAEVFLDCLVLNEERLGAVADVVTAAVNHMDAPGDLGIFAQTAVLLDEHFPGDPSLLAALLLNRRTMRPGEALHIRPGTLHTYLSGTAVEVMASSDNVLRGGLTSKHIDAPALVQVVDFTAQPMPLIRPEQQAPGLWHYPTGEQSFSAWRLDVVSGRRIALPAEDSGRILVVTSGEIVLATSSDALVLRRGQAAFLRAGDQVSASGEGQAFLAATGTDV